MAGKADSVEKLKVAQQYFRSLGIEGWVETNASVQSGGQATILVVKRSDGMRGAFRFTTESDEQSLDRFAREIEILSEYEHPNILKVLDFSKRKTHPWYISKLGTPFKPYWNRRREELAADPEQLVQESKSVVRQLADGLARLHERGIVHRDIKPGNIIVQVGDTDSRQPVLIDFGLAYIEGGPRLSNVNETVGNIRFSPDVAMYRMDDVPPWLDVHNLAQLFMWMTRVYPDKDWTRALDPRWVSYDSRLAEGTILSVRALTALCTEQSVSPRDAREFGTLIDQLFPITTPASGGGIDMSGIDEGRKLGVAAFSLAAAQDTRTIAAGFPVVAKIYFSLRESLDALFTEISAAGIFVNKESDVEIDTFRLRLLQHDGIALDQQLVHWQVGDSSENVFSFRIYINGIVPSRRGEVPAERFPNETSNPFYFHLLLRRSQMTGTFPNRTKILTINDNGSLFLRDDVTDEPIEILTDEVVGMVKQWLEDANVWEALHKFR